VSVGNPTTNVSAGGAAKEKDEGKIKPTTIATPVINFFIKPPR
jgi:hypothetical protein